VPCASARNRNFENEHRNNETQETVRFARSWSTRGAVAMDMDLAGDSPADGGGPHAGEKIPIVVEVCMRSTSTARQDDVRDAIEVYLEDLGSVIYAEGPLAMPSAEDDPYLHAHVESARVTDIGTLACEHPRLPPPPPPPAPARATRHPRDLGTSRGGHPLVWTPERRLTFPPVAQARTRSSARRC
jgi:hypothetical protein